MNDVVALPAPNFAVSTMARLRSATWPSHQRLEKRLDVKARFSHLDAYRAHLQQMWGFCAALEEQLGLEAFGGALMDYESRRKLPLLTRDLLSLGVESRAVRSIARCETLPRCTDPAAAFGSAYVLEGATLGGRTLLPMVESRLGFTALAGATFLASYGEEVAPMWRSFGAAVDGWCSDDERQLSAVRAAVATFDALDTWLCASPAFS